MTKTVFTTELDAAVALDLGRLAEKLQRAPSDIIADAVARFVEDEATFWREIDEADAAIDRGEYVTHEELVAELKAIVATARTAD